ncbi:hypothetical protein [Flavivirga rizhaonensis]|uniref:Uncharacterized protein n=1 Tax=Flavivirga rizhaonensis TaxID=2559571 RepID=A0A4S1DUL3_9FLAO|nr:hypothetical protein [Flavivirga rizhaonensis]TGV01760.1 hypothetical protein EM932_13875 [Flavivirga rizhaonensis]
MQKTVITKKEINTSNVSDDYKEAILNAYEYAQEDEKGYFFDAACKVFKYILELTDEIPNDKSNGIDYNKLVDNSAPWSEIDTRIIKVIIHRTKKDDDEYLDLFKLSSWLFHRLEKVSGDDFASYIFKILQEQKLITSEKDMILSLILSYSAILIRNKQITSFGKIALSYVDDILTLVKKEEESEAILEMYNLLKKEAPEQFKNRFETLLEDMINSGTNGRYYAIKATERDHPERALQYAKEKSLDKYISTAYRVCFYAKDKVKEHYKKLLFDLYKEYGIDSGRSKRVMDIWGEHEGQKILKLLSEKNNQ